MKAITDFGKVIMELPPTANNPRNSEGAFFSLKNGELLFAFGRYKGENPDDSASADICLIRSADNGETFSEQEIIFTCEEEKAKNIMSLSFLEMQNGDIGLFYLVRTTYSLMRMYLRRSSDGGKTWGERVICTPQEGFFVVNNDRVRRLSSGRIIIPAAIHRKGYSESPNDGGYYDPRSDATFFFSDDDGKSWEWGYGKCVLPDTAYSNAGLQEPGVIELSEALLWGYARTDLGRHYEMFSFDEGKSWTAPQPSRFTAPCSPLCMKRSPRGDIYAIWNPIPIYNGRSEFIGENNDVWNGGRTPFVIARSVDNGKTFSEPVAFETDENSGYAYCAIHFTDDFMFLAYCAGSLADRSCLVRSRLRRIELRQLDDIFEG